MIGHSALFIAALATAAAAALGFPTPTASAGRAVRAVVSESPIRASVDAPRTGRLGRQCDVAAAEVDDRKGEPLRPIAGGTDSSRRSAATRAVARRHHHVSLHRYRGLDSAPRPAR
jgi:hypothetical protein